MEHGDNELKLIAQYCNMFEHTDPQTVINKIEELQLSRSEAELIPIYNYLLSIAQNPDVMMYLIKCLDKYRHPSSLEILTDTLLLKNGIFKTQEEREKYTNVRVMCAKAIANHKNTDVVSALLYCLNNKNENYRIRLACADALGKIGDKYAVAPLIDIVKDEDEKSIYVKESAALALGILGDERAIDPLVSILEAKQGIMDKFSFLKERAIEALNKMGFGSNERVFKALKSSLSDESAQIRINAVEALMECDHPLAFETIKKCLFEDNDEEVKKNAMIALYNMSDKSILDEIIASDKFSDTLKQEAKQIIDEYE